MILVFHLPYRETGRLTLKRTMGGDGFSQIPLNFDRDFRSDSDYPHEEALQSATLVRQEEN